MIEGISFAPAQPMPKNPKGLSVEMVIEDALTKAGIAHEESEDRHGNTRVSVGDLVIRIGDPFAHGDYVMDAENLLIIAAGKHPLELTEEQIMKNMRSVIRQLQEEAVHGH